MSHGTDERVEGALARLDPPVVQARTSHESLTANLMELGNAEVTVRSPRGECSVTARADGAIVQVRLDPRPDPGPLLEELLTAAAASAQREAGQTAADRARTLLGQGSPLMRDISLHASERG